MTNRIQKAEAVDVSAILRADLAENTKYKYAREIQRMHAAGVTPSNTEALKDYAASLTSSRRAFLKAGLRTMYRDLEISLKGAVTVETLPETQAAVMRLEAMRDAVQVRKHKGQKSHLWLSTAQVADLVALPWTMEHPNEQKRDYIILAALLGAGLRREELATLTFDALSTQGSRYILDVTGKGAKDRIIPINAKLAAALQDWQAITGNGRVARRLSKGKKIGPSLTAVGVYDIVSKYGVLLGLPELAPHDLRRTFAQLGYAAGVDVTQISVLLGHESIETTRRYLNLNLDLEVTASDFIPL